MPPKKSEKSKNGNGVSLGIENELWEAADKPHGHLDVAEIFALRSVIVCECCSQREI